MEPRLENAQQEGTKPTKHKTYNDNQTLSSFENYLLQIVPSDRK